MGQVEHGAAAIPLDDIVVGARLRPADPAVVQALAASLAREGLMQPIGVRVAGRRQRPHLVWGLHRLEAARQLGWETIPASFVTGSAGSEVEALENLCRAELVPYDRAVAVRALRRAMLEAAGLDGDADARMARGLAPADGVERAKFALSDLAARLGVSLRSVQYDIDLARTLRPRTAEAMRGRDGWKTARLVQACAGLSATMYPRDDGGMDDGQDRLVAWLSAYPEAGLKEALTALQPGVTPTRDEAAYAALTGAFARLSASQRVPTLVEVARTLTVGQRTELAARLAAIDAAGAA
jgi:hypothetical protein